MLTPTSYSRLLLKIELFRADDLMFREVTAWGEGGECLTDLLLFFVANSKVSLQLGHSCFCNRCNPASAGVRLPSAECGRSLL